LWIENVITLLIICCTKDNHFWTKSRLICIILITTLDNIKHTKDTRFNLPLNIYFEIWIYRRHYAQIMIVVFAADEEKVRLKVVNQTYILISELLDDLLTVSVFILLIIVTFWISQFVTIDFLLGDQRPIFCISKFWFVIILNLRSLRIILLPGKNIILFDIDECNLVKVLWDSNFHILDAIVLIRKLPL